MVHDNDNELCRALLIIDLHGYLNPLSYYRYPYGYHRLRPLVHSDIGFRVLTKVNFHPT